MKYEQPKEEILTNKETERRSVLKQRKPLAYEKAVHINDKFLRGECAALISFCYDYICNMNCAHCSNSAYAPKDRCFTIEDVRELARQADEMGLFQFELSGGEPLIFPQLDQIPGGFISMLRQTDTIWTARWQNTCGKSAWIR